MDYSLRGKKRKNPFPTRRERTNDPKTSFRQVNSSLLGRVAFAFTVTCCLRNGHYYSVPRRVCQEVFRIIFIIIEKSRRGRRDTLRYAASGAICCASATRYVPLSPLGIRDMPPCGRRADKPKAKPTRIESAIEPQNGESPQGLAVLLLLFFIEFFAPLSAKESGKNSRSPARRPPQGVPRRASPAGHPPSFLISSPRRRNTATRAN